MITPPLDLSRIHDDGCARILSPCERVRYDALECSRETIEAEYRESIRIRISTVYPESIPSIELSIRELVIIIE
jgi:hypothetical protein